MTAPRIARASRSRFYIGLGILILTIGFVAIFHSSQQQLDELRHLEMRCEQQQESLNSQITIVEKSLKSERYDHQQTKNELQKRAKEDKEHRDKLLMESNLKLTSLQQHYKLLHSQHEDLTDDCAKNKEQQSEEINGLQTKLKSIINQNTQITREKDKEIEHLKVQIQLLENEKHILVKKTLQDQSTNGDSESITKIKYANYKLANQIEAYKLHCPWNPDIVEHNQDQMQQPEIKELEKYFNSQIPVSENLYKIPIKIINHTNSMPENGVGISNNKGNVINSVENFQFIPKLLLDNSVDNKVLPEPPINVIKSSTASSDRNITSENNIDIKLRNAPIPTATSSNKLKTSSTTSATRKLVDNLFKTKSRQVPEGVVPVPENINDMLIKNDDNSENQNNRYSMVVNEIVAKKPIDKPLNDNNFQNNNDIDNGAREVNDNNDFLMDERIHKDHLQEVLQGNKINVNNNAAEEDSNLYDKAFNLAKPNEGINMEAAHKDDKLSHNNKLLNEIDADQGKVAAYPDDIHMEEQLEEEDDDEYSNPLARKQDPAVRN